MKRFYSRAIKVLKSEEVNHRELADDIDDYVEHLEFVRAILVSELSKAQTYGGRDLLRQLGYKIPAKLEEKENVS